MDVEPWAAVSVDHSTNLNASAEVKMAGIETALAIPGVIDVIVRGGEVVYRKVETFRRQHEVMSRYAQR